MNNPEAKIEEVASSWRFKRHIYTDPIWMEYVIEETNPELRNQLAAVRLKTVAAVYTAIAQGATNAAQVFAKGA